MSITSKDIPEDWKNSLALIQQVFPNSLIGGGALRDLWHNKSPKDIDIFVPVDGKAKDWNDLIDDIGIELIEMFEGTHNVTLKASSIYGKSNLQRNIVCVYSVEAKSNHDVLGEWTNLPPYEIIVQDTSDMEPDVMSIISGFDLSICQLGFDGKSVFVTPAFVKTIATNQITVMNVNREDRQEKRLNKILKKYPEYTRGE